MKRVLKWVNLIAAPNNQRLKAPLSIIPREISRSSTNLQSNVNRNLNIRDLNSRSSRKRKLYWNVKADNLSLNSKNVEKRKDS